MSEWQVSLELVDESSSKFWRARIDGASLYVNFGRIGTTGQTQVKQLASSAEAEKELAKLEREKRKKGYADAGSVAPADEDADEDAGEDADEDEAPAAATPPTDTTARLILDRDGRRVELTLTATGLELRMVAVERYASAEAARAALERTRAGVESEGYQLK
jgi:predicted DNA-binding WGR domain protein